MNKYNKNLLHDFDFVGTLFINSGEKMQRAKKKLGHVGKIVPHKNE